MGTDKKVLLELKDITVKAQEKTLLEHVSLEVGFSETLAILGPNGAGKSTLANLIMGLPNLKREQGKIIFNGEDMSSLSPDERAKRGIFLSFQHPLELEGVNMLTFLRASYNAVKGKNLKIKEFKDILKDKLELAQVDKSFTSRFLNYKFSGGEKKRSEILQLLLLEPKLAILDEIDSGLDVDAFKVIVNIIKTLQKQTGLSLILISHNAKMYKELTPDKVVILKKGRILESGGTELIEKIETKGFS
ncbi:Fe-S cluster assembly ATPase SufC [Candidatus Woesearchaeota archaeon]|nr:Fe-S cluster assembly ATPase SufC [Nanoarchaeota archaeon]MCB9370315.1 Fe-S cluster assembly ATPase SufC [Candidatus Woesearchaeota archaeon]USN44837.1 MAG: Fe-S cluster assembly ATPase SufC [Candidatus Woesearchaeota archaeon]